MSQIDISQWKEFPLSHMFDICYGKFIPKKDRGTKTPMITTTADNNGISYYVDSDPLFSGDALTVASDGSVGSTFYQDKDFSAGNIVVVLEPKKSTKQNWSPRSAQFLATCIKRYALIKYGWANKYSVNRVRNTKLPLPVDKNSDPNWQYMDTYIAKLTALAHKNVSSLKKVKAKPAKLNIDHWGEFKISDIYEHIEHPVARSKKHYESGNIPFIASGAINNGIDCYLAPKNEQDIDKGNCLTISPVDGSCFYQPNDFLGRGGGGSAISILRTNKSLSQATHVFLASIISHTLKEQYSFGNMGNTQKIKDTIIKLPIDAKGEPDWEYMDNQVRHLATLSNLTITSLDPAELPIFVGEWKEFKISKLCYVLKGHRLTKKHMIDGNIRYIGASYSNNGITHMIGNTEYLFPANTITMAYNGSIGAAFYQDQEYWATDDINVIKPKMKLTQNQIFFLMSCIQQRAQSFSFVNKWTQAKMLNTVIKLPVNFNGDPDWQYMDRYISWIKQYSKNKLTLIQ